MKYRRAVITKPGGPEVLAVIEQDLSDPRPDELQLYVLASGVAYGNTMKRLGLNPGMPKMPYTPGYDLVGEVVATGNAVRRFKIGDRVAGFVVNGANAEYVNFPERLFVAVPSRCDPVEALCLVLNYVTADQMLHRKARVQPGQRILVHGAAGGVGTALLQLGKLDQLQMYGTASSTKHDVVRALGATPIDYKTEDFVHRVLELTGDGVDAAFDPIGGAHLAQSREALKRGGRLVAFGMSSAVRDGMRAVIATLSRVWLYNLIPDGKSCHFYGIRDQQAIQQDLTRLLALLEQRKIEPIIAAKLPLSQIAQAHELMDTSSAIGKVVLVPD